MTKPSDRRIREYLLKEELHNFLIDKNLQYDIFEINENVGFSHLFNKIKDYEIILMNKKGEKYTYNSYSKTLFINVINITVEFMQGNLNKLIKLEKFLNSFFEERNLK
jgi:hypothetical protein